MVCWETEIYERNGGPRNEEADKIGGDGGRIKKTAFFRFSAVSPKFFVNFYWYNFLIILVIVFCFLLFFFENINKVNEHLKKTRNDNELNIQTLTPPRLWLKREGIKLCQEVYDKRGKQSFTIKNSIRVLENLENHSVAYFSTRNILYVLRQW